ncbi:19582_t:CDS:1, partial [Racocetra fulgida]
MLTLFTFCEESEEYEPTPARNEPEEYGQTLSHHESEDFESSLLLLNESEA